MTTDVERRSLAALVARLLGGDPPVDWAALPMPLVRRHLLAPLAFAAGATAFRTDHVAAGLQAERRAVVLDEALAALAGIDVILLKGIAYAGTLYPDPALRPMSDIDLLVPAAAFDRAEQALRRAGYWHAGSPAQASVTRHARTLKRRDGSIDLHRHIVHAGRSRIDLDAIWRAARPAHVAGARRPAPLHEYLLHVAHIGRHEGVVPLVNYVDLDRLERALDPAAAAAIDGLAVRWWVARATRAARAAVVSLRGQVPGGSWRFPSGDQLLGGEPAARWLQLARKAALADDWRSLVGLLGAAARGRLAPLRARRG